MAVSSVLRWHDRWGFQSRKFLFAAQKHRFSTCFVDNMAPVKETQHLAAGSVAPERPESLRLYNMRYCPYAQRTRLVLEAKNIKHEIVNINLLNKPEWYLAKNPLGKVPCLELLSGELIIESLITADYLDEAYPEPRSLYPSDPLRKAQDRVFMELFNKVTGPMYKLYHSKDEETRVKLLAELAEGLGIFEAEIVKRGSPYFGGEQPGMLDYMIWPWCERLPALKILIGGVAFPEDKFSQMRAWGRRMKEDPAVKVMYFSPEIHSKFIASHLAGKPDYDMDYKSSL